MSYRLTFLFLVLFPIMAPYAHAQVMCGDFITTDTILEADVGPCDSTNSPALTIQGPATLDLNSFTVFCDSESLLQDRAEGIHLIGKGARLVNGTLKDCKTGVQIMGTGHHRVSGIVSRDNHSVCFEIHLGSDKNILTYNTSQGFTCDDGFENSGDKNMFTNNLASDHDDSGFDNRGNENTFRSNVSVNSAVGFSIDGMYNKVVANIATNTSSGFILGNSVGSSNNDLDNNRAVANNIGIQIFATTATNNSVEDNFSLGNDMYDMVDDNDACDNNAWLNNLFRTAFVNNGDGDQTCIR
jgi:hypothetical protein